MPSKTDGTPERQQTGVQKGNPTVQTQEFVALPLDQFTTEFVQRLQGNSFPTQMRKAADRLASIVQGVIEGGMEFDEAYNRLDKAFTYIGKTWIATGNAAKKKYAVLTSIRDLQRKLEAEIIVEAPQF